jgi:hypothetical protein
MNSYILDRRGRYWKKDIFESFTVDYSNAVEPTVLARCYSADYGGDITVEFPQSQWEAGDSSVVIPANGHFVIDTFIDSHTDQFHYEVVPVFAWRVVGDGSLRPVTFNAGADEGEPDEGWVVGHASGQVVEYERVWPSLQDYLSHREMELRKRHAANDQGSKAGTKSLAA